MMKTEQSDDRMKKRLAFPEGRIPVVLDTDAYNEVDDQFAVAYMLCNRDKFDVKGIHAAPFFIPGRSGSPADGMEKSYEELLRLLDAMDLSPQGLVFRGSEGHMTPAQFECTAPDFSTADEPLRSEAAEHLISLAMERSTENPLYVIIIGASTNVASAIALCPEIKDRIVVMWLTGHTAPVRTVANYDFNALGDLYAARRMYDSGVPLIQMGCYGVTSHLLTTMAELDLYLKGKNRLCDILVENFRGYNDDHYGWSKEIWDVGAVAYYVNPEWYEMEFIPSPKIILDVNAPDYLTYGWSESKKIIYGDESRHNILAARWLNRNEIFKDLFKKLGNL